ncbi:Nitrogen permease regulator 3 [Basidiobolus ranarum]|uniref:Nitrogen permease regulator 3 n=2 Tax=Basidiobolus ranarum TaxID=34480 RepID=A0ABR2WY21_9FUNG
MPSLLAILLIVNSSRGHHFVFRYPKNSVSNAERNEIPPDFGDNIQSSFKRLSVSNPDVSEARRNWLAENLFGYEPHLLADILSPKASLCDSRFQLTIDELTFVGHPTLIVRNLSKRNESISDNGKNGVKGEFSSPEYSPGGEQQGNINTPVSQVTMFHLVFVMEPAALDLNREVDDLYNHVITKFTAALRYEQIRCGYVRQEADRIMTLTDEAGTNIEFGYDELMGRVLAQSSLARDIARIYYAVKTKSVAQVEVNNYISLSLQIPPYLPKTSPNFLEDEDTESTEYQYEHYPVLRPYHTLLLLENSEQLLSEMPFDSSPTLIQFIKALTPTKSLAELHEVIDCSLAQIYRLAAHLIYWRKAKLIDAISIRNVYVIPPRANFSNISTVAEHFQLDFPQLDLFTLMSSFSTPKAYSSIIPSKEQRSVYIEALVHLLKKDLVIQLHTYIYLMIPKHIKLGYNVEELEELQHDMSTELVASSTYSLISGSEQATDVERDWLKRLASSQPREVASLFQRLTQYFDGKHHVEEIMYRENLSRKEFKLILNRYQEYLVTVLHP